MDSTMVVGSSGFGSASHGVVLGYASRVGVRRRGVVRWQAVRALGLATLACLMASPLGALAVVSHNVVTQWNDAAIQGIRDAKLGAPVAARALAIVHTCIYDAWSVYDEHAIGTQLRGALRRPVG